MQTAMRIGDMISSYDFTNPVFQGALKHIPEYVLKLASKRRGVACHYNSAGLAKRQKNYFLYEAQ